MTDRHSISPYPIRMPHELREKLEESARKGSRSLHAEIISRLNSSFSPKTLDDFSIIKAAELDKEIARLSLEIATRNRTVDNLLKEARKSAGTPDEDSFGPLILKEAEAIGKLEREKFQVMMRREMIDD